MNSATRSILSNRSILYYISFAIYSIYYIISFSTIHLPNIDFLITAICVSLLLLYNLFQKFSSKKFIYLCIFFIIGLLSLIYSKQSVILLLLLYIISAYRVDIITVSKIIFIVELCLLIVIPFLSFLNVIDTVYLYSSERGLRSSLGFTHPNRFGINVLTLCCAYSTFRFPKIKFYDIAFYIFCCITVSNIADSRTSSLLILLLPCINILVKYLKKSNKIFLLYYIFIVIFFVLLISSFAITFLYNSNSSWQYNLNNLLSNRPFLWNYYYKHNLFTLFGRPDYSSTAMLGVHNFVIDNSFIKLMIVYGIVPLFIFIFIYIKIFQLMFKFSYMNVAGLIVLALSSFFEQISLSISLNYFLLIFIWCITIPNVEKERVLS